MGYGDKVAIADVTCTKATDKAILCEHDDWDDPIWFPLSQVDDDSEVYQEGDAGKLVVTEWIAEQKGLA